MKDEFDKNKAIKMAEEMGAKASDRDIQLVDAKIGGMKKGPLEKIWDKVLSLYEAFRSPNTPGPLKIMIIGALIYMVSPLDLFYDFFPFIGLVDDVAVITYAFTLLLRETDCSAVRVYPRKGDIICKNSAGGLYQHYGIYVGDNKVVHFSGPKGQEINPLEADINETTLKDFLKGEKLYIMREKSESKLKPLPEDEIVRRARNEIGRHKGSYDLVFNNCEHFAYYCRFGVKKSQQVEDVASSLVALLVR